jgi:hypothetical protein
VQGEVQDGQECGAHHASQNASGGNTMAGYTDRVVMLWVETDTTGRGGRGSARMDVLGRTREVDVDGYNVNVCSCRLPSNVR